MQKVVKSKNQLFSMEDIMAKLKIEEATLDTKKEQELDMSIEKKQDNVPELKKTEEAADDASVVTANKEPQKSESDEEEQNMKIDLSKGLSEKQLAELKKKYKKLFMTDYMGKRYIWHRLNRKTFNTVCDETDEIEDEDTMLMVREQAFVKACVVYPDAKTLEEDIKDEMVSTRIGREILYHSGFYPPQTVEL